VALSVNGLNCQQTFVGSLNFVSIDKALLNVLKKCDFWQEKNVEK